MRHFLIFIIALLFIACNQKDVPAPATAVAFQPTPVKATNAIDRFEPEIIEFEKEDLVRPFMKGEILMTGSSSIRLWKSMKEDFPDFRVHNRGFGGSTLPELMHYADRIIFKYRPSTIFLYCGENDIADGASPEDVFSSFKIFISMMKKKLPDTKLVYLAMKPSVARWNLWTQYQKGNKLIQEYTTKHPKLDYIAVDEPMLMADGKVNPDIFVEDMLHMNEQGYAMWTKLVKNYLEGN